MSKTLTNSLALLNQIKSQFDSNKDFRESKATDPKNYGSIKRSQNGNATATQYSQPHYPRLQRNHEEN